MEFFNHLFFDFKGRIGRKAFWLGSLCIVLAQTFVILALAQVFGIAIADMVGPDLNTDQINDLADKLDVLGALTALIFLWPSLAIYAKRWHDRDKSAWWTLIAFIPIVGQIWAIIELGFFRGSKGPNRFGIDPIAKG